MKLMLTVTIILWSALATGQNIFAPMILTASASAPAAWSKLGSSTTTEMPMWQTSFSFNHTVTSGTSILIVGVVTYDAGYVSAITFNGDALTLAVDSYTSYAESFRTQVWYLTSPDAGTYTISMTFSEQITDLVAGASNFDGIAITSPVRDTGINGGSSSTPSAAVDGAQTGDLIYGVVNFNTTPLSTSDTEDWEKYHEADNLTGGAARKTATGSAATINWSSGINDWYAVCVAFKLQ